MASTFQKSYDFSQLDQLPNELYWLNGQPNFELVSQDSGAGLRVTPTDERDFWQRTFYTPPLVKSDGHALLCKIPDGLKEWRAEIRFSLESAASQFDQAGIMVYVDPERWLKAGVEVVDGVPRMSCVVTNVFSDWSVQPWHSVTDVAIRISHTRDSLAVEYGTDGDKWHFYRIAPSMIGQATAAVGMVCCSPKKAGMTAVFHSFSVTDHVSFNHHS